MMNSLVGTLTQTVDSSVVGATGTIDRKSLKLSRFEALTSLFLALILFLGVFVSMMFILWLLSVSTPFVQASRIERSTPSANRIGFAREFESPGAEEVEELLEPTLADTLKAVTDAASSLSASPTPTATDSIVSSKGRSPGDTRSPVPGSDGADVIGRWQRWEIAFSTTGKKDYAFQLDFFKIELAAFGGGENVIESASNLSTRPKRHVNRDPESEKRLYFSWKRKNPLIQFDRQLLAAAGIRTSGRNVIRFTPQGLERRLAQMEKEYCESNGKRFPDDIAKTVFQSLAKDDRFEFKIVSQRYRPGR